MRTTVKIILLASAAAVSFGGAMAQSGSRYYEPPQGYYGSPPPVNPPQQWLAEGRSVAGWDRYRYDYSGTRGRMGLGADPMHPEGPGNSTFGR
jgi:hypothetical protein